ncbi:MAG: hypothetical protein Q7T45_14400 [Bradyrhizobium sp.]|uniref:hypothetical protein n=1 Tax=Bradyrhizobium sp. TaxID=376 RepID=UPI00271A0BDE|nr:hypothetical protein [Bradyrhizobium sp.]MDO8399004.1 hypothetical protein [Bradyrhizobium sp.]
MSDLSAEIQLRPTRIGFLVEPADLASVRSIMRACTCLWGGVYNPIIPVFNRPPTEWKSETYDRFKGAAVAKGYVRFFEPDVYVEAKAGLLEKAGLRALRPEYSFHSHVITLKELLEPEPDRSYSEPQFGLNIQDILGHIYKTEQKFVLRDKRESVVVKPQRGNALVESVFGVYPTTPDVDYIRQAYTDVYKPEEVDATPENWRRVFQRGAETPLRVTRHGLNTQRYWYHDLLVFVFDPARATDLIDLWNLRLEPHPVLPVPIGWFVALADDIFDLLQSEHRSVAGNPNGIMHHATIEFGRSIRKKDAEALVHTLKPGLPPGALTVKYWRNSIWIDHRDDRMHRDTRLKVVANEKRADLLLKEDGQRLHTTFEALEPEFSIRHSKGDHRWVNVLRLSNYGKKSVASLLPFNTFDRTWPSLALGGESVAVGGEGWVFPQSHKNLGQYVSLMNPEEAIIGSLKQLGIRAKLSEPGHIAKQMLEHLGGLWGVHLLADLDTLKLLNKMAGGMRRKRNEVETIEETFELRTASLKVWTKLVSRRKEKRSSSADLVKFTAANIIRLGVETECPHCSAKKWSTLTAVDYRVVCDRCLKLFEFPEAGLRDHNRNWTYRVVGPFSVPDYGRGSYSALLALRVLSRYRSAMDRMTFATAMNLSFDGIDREVDFIAWHAGERMQETHRPPQLVIGEAKSFGQGESITSSELAKLRQVVTKLPEAVIVIAVLRDHFTPAEKKMLTSFVKWGRRVNLYGEPTNPVLLLTSHELMMDHYVSSTWKELGGKHAKFADYNNTRTLFNFADATQQIYLGMPSFHLERDNYWKKRHARRLARQASKQVAV